MPAGLFQTPAQRAAVVRVRHARVFDEAGWTAWTRANATQSWRRSFFPLRRCVESTYLIDF
jgi:hypothetical protein